MLGCWVVLLSQGVTQVLLQPLRNQMYSVFPEEQGKEPFGVFNGWQDEEPLQLIFQTGPSSYSPSRGIAILPVTPIGYRDWFYTYKKELYSLPITLDRNKGHLLYRSKWVPMGKKTYLIHLGKWMTQLGPTAADDGWVYE